MRRNALAGVSFFLSGASALVYQVAWQRILALHSGVGIYSVAMIVGAFMAGLGIGSWVGGAFSARVEPRQALRLFALIEIAVSIFGASSCFLYYDWLYPRAAQLYADPWAASLMHLLALLPPTVLMGTSLPFLVRALVDDPGDASQVIGYLYGVNLLGASFGALATPWVLIRYFGVRGGVLWAAGGNLLAAGGAVLLLRELAQTPSRSTRAGMSSAPSHESEIESHRPFGLWLALYALSGFCALSLEILWFRIVDVAVKGSAFAFGTVLSLYLLGSAAGVFVGVRIAQRLRRPLAAFLMAQCALLSTAGCGILVLSRLPVATPGYRWLYAYWGSFDVFRMDARLYLLLPLLLFGLPTLFMGVSFPILQRAVQDEVRTSGRKVGFLQAANIFGCLAGSLVVGLLLLDRWGTIGTLRAELLVGVAFGVLGLGIGGRRRFLVAALGLAFLAAALPTPRRFWLRLHGREDDASVLREDRTGVVVIRPQGGGEWAVLLNGKSNSLLPFAGVHTALGATPTLIHPRPRDVAIVGLGSGDTAWAAGCRPETLHVSVFELLKGQWSALTDVAARPGSLPGLVPLLTDPRYTLRLEDGRNALDRGEARWDVIETDALHPPSAYSGNVYSVEFFALCRRRLRPGGLMCTWSPTARIRVSFRKAFPHVLEGMWNDVVMVGSNDPIGIDRTAWRRRVESPEVVAYLGEARAREVWVRCLETAQPGEHPSPGLADANLDLFPRDEFRTP